MIMKVYNTVLFDLDGTLTDSKPGILRCIKLALDEKGISYTQDILDKMVGPPFRISMKEFFGIEGEIVEELIKIYRAEYEVDGWKECSIYDGVTDLLKTLKSKGIRVALATSKPLKFTLLMMDGLDLSKYFDFIGGASSDSSKESKADVIRSVFDALNLKSGDSVLMVGDRLYDIVGAKECGIDCAAVAWGYGSFEEFEEYGADYVLRSPADVLQLAGIR